MDAIAMGVLGKAIEHGDPLGIALALASTMVFGLLLNGIRKGISRIEKTVHEGFALGEARFKRIETEQALMKTEIVKIDGRLSVVEKPTLGG